MDTLVAPPATPQHGAVVPPRRPEPGNRRRRGVISGAVLVLLAALAASGLWVGRLQPLAVGSLGWGPTDLASTKVIPQLWSGLPGSPEVFRIDATGPGQTITYRFSIRNDGPVGITVTGVGVPLSTQAGYALTVVPVRMHPNTIGAGLDPNRWYPFRSFAMAPGQEASIEMQATWHGCMVRGTTTSFGEVPISFRVFGVPRTVQFTPDVQIDLAGQQPTC